MERIENAKCAIYVSEKMEYNLPQDKQVAYIKKLLNSWNSEDSGSNFLNPILIETYVDNETDNQSPNYKKEYRRMLSDAEAGKFNYVFCTSYTAISMNYIECIANLKRAIANIYPIPLEFIFIIEAISTNGREDYSFTISFEKTMKEMLKRRDKIVSNIKKATVQ